MVMAVLEAVLFDLDDTLLQTDTDAFVRRYFSALEVYFANGDAVAPGRLTRWIMQATAAMVDVPHPERTNLEAFTMAFARLSGMAAEVVWPRFDRFYQEIYPTLGEGLAPMPGGREAVDAARAQGLKVAVATNPLFPLGAVRHRLLWAGLPEDRFDLVTTLENMHWTKPNLEYYAEVAARLGVDPKRCLMVGDSQENDIEPARHLGMLTYLVGEGDGAHASGDMHKLARALKDGGL